MAVFTAAFAAVAVTAAQDVFEIVAPANSRVAILGLFLGQYSDAGDAAAEILGLSVVRGYTTSGSGGASVTPVNNHGHSGALAATATVERNNTTVAQDGTAAVLLSTAWNVQLPFVREASNWLDEIWVLSPSQRLVVRITAPADELTMNGTLVFEEMGNGS
jgi:hypothetical protein